MLIEIKGAQFSNHGARLMLDASLERLRSRFPQARFAMSTGPNASPAELSTVPAVNRIRLHRREFDLTPLAYHLPRALHGWLLRRHRVCEPGLSAVLDVSGYAYGDRWGVVSASQTAAQLVRMHAHGRPYVFMPQTFGPFTSPRFQVFGAALRRAALICPRDDVSQDHVTQLLCGAPSVLLRAPDITIGMAANHSALAASGVTARTVLVIPNARLLDRPSQLYPDTTGDWQTGYVPMLLRLIKTMTARGHLVRILNHGGAEDLALCDVLAAAVSDRRVIREEDPAAVKGVIGAAGLVISSRYHGCVHALSQGVPCIGTSWSHKYQALFTDFAASANLLTTPDVTHALQLLEPLLEFRGVNSRALALCRQMAFDVDALWERVFTILATSVS